MDRKHFLDATMRKFKKKMKKSKSCRCFGDLGMNPFIQAKMLRVVPVVHCKLNLNVVFKLSFSSRFFKVKLNFFN